MSYKPPSPTKRSAHPHEKALDAMEAQLSTMKNMDTTQRDALLVLSRSIAQLKDDQKRVAEERLAIEKSKIPTPKIPTTPRKSISPFPSPNREDRLEIVNTKEMTDPFQVASIPDQKNRAINALNNYETPIRKSSLLDSPFKSITRGISSTIDNITTHSPSKTSNSTRTPSTYKTVYSPSLIPLTLQPSRHPKTTTTNSKSSLAPSMSPTRSRARARASSVDQASGIFSWSGMPSLFSSNTSQASHSLAITQKEESSKSTRVPINFRFMRQRGETLLQPLTKIDRSTGARLEIETPNSQTSVALDLSFVPQRDNESNTNSRPATKDVGAMTVTTVNDFLKQSRLETRDESTMHYDGVNESNKSDRASLEGDNSKYYIHIDPSQVKNLRRRTLPPSIDVIKACEDLPHSKHHKASIANTTIPQITPPCTTTATTTTTVLATTQNTRKVSGESKNFHKGRYGSRRWNSTDATTSPSQVLRMRQEALYPDSHTQELSALRKKFLQLQNSEDQESDISLEELIDAESKRDLSSSHKGLICSTSPPSATSSSKGNSPKATDYNFTLSKLSADTEGASTKDKKSDKIGSSFLGGSMYTGRSGHHSRSLSSGFEVKSKEYQARLGKTLKRRSRPVSHGGDGKFEEKKPFLEGSDDGEDMSSPVFL